MDLLVVDLRGIRKHPVQTLAAVQIMLKEKGHSLAVSKQPEA